MTPQDEKLLILQSLTATEKNLEESLRSIGSFRVRIAGLSDTSPTMFTLSEQKLVLSALSAAKLLSMLERASRIRNLNEKDQEREMRRFEEEQLEEEYRYDRLLLKWKNADPIDKESL